MTRWSITFGILVLSLLIAQIASATPAFLSNVPNGTANMCDTCHISTVAPVSWNAFGEDVLETLSADVPDWAAVCSLDSDGDGATNGLELADPDCIWVFGDSDPAGDVFNPGDDTDAPEVTIEEDAGGSTDTDDVGEPGPEDDGAGDPPPDTGGGTTTTDGGGCAGGPSAPLAGLALLTMLALVTRRRLV